MIALDALVKVATHPVIRLNVADHRFHGGPAPELTTEFLLSARSQLLAVERLGDVDDRLADERFALVAPVDGDVFGRSAEDRLVLLNDGWQRVAVVRIAEAERPDDHARILRHCQRNLVADRRPGRTRTSCGLCPC